ncbi:Outer membrane receptor proteins, mostly Fe transport [Reichenbachiella agariperforans]|uniref:Outer membrane receptor proteins, mostly Fe transport n=1 Tax=Reichenbachiella agariperforans TaxID=156994 RepID=A0A1M6NTY3_REIAG|nr:outer membrane beta-barrel protein [Reichenbachiella agariperforans]SHJ99072.1 Outer membrane receptor proteins, mostly Fe transport [Reichenbachiella agariperforans]
MKRIALVIISMTIGWATYGQEVIKSKVYGRLVDKTDGPMLIGATVQLFNIKDSTKSRYAVTDVEGIFLIKDVESAFYKMNIKSLGYKPYSRTVRISIEEMNFGNIFMEQDEKVLEGIEVQGAVVAMEVKGDTVQYNADAYKVNPDASTADLVKKMPGIVIDENGVSANGETVEQVLLDGKRFFGQDPLLSLNTIPAEVVQKVEVFDQKSERSQFTGYDDGNTTKTMNVVTKEGKRNGQFGKAYAGYGTDDRYKIGANVNSFKDDQRLTVIGMTNNINQQNFSGEDLAGISGGGGGFRRGNNSLMTGTQSGITQTNSLGLNFTDEWGTKAKFEGSYFFNQTNNSRDETTNREIYNGDSIQYYDEIKNADTDNLNHRLDARITYDINDDNKLTIRPRISYQNNESLTFTDGATVNGAGTEINRTENNYRSSNEAFNIDNYISYMHKFDKIGRTWSLELETNYKETDRENYYEDIAQDSITQYLTDETDYTIESTLGYTEPIGNTAQLSATYELSYRERNSDKNTYNINPDSGAKNFNTQLSNHFVSGYTQHKTEVSLSNRSMGTFYRFGLAYQYAELANKQIQPETGNFVNRFNSILPFAMGRIELGSEADVFIRYRTSTSTPSINQLQNVIDNSNPLFISTGNPELDQSYSHSLMIRFNKPNPDKNRSIANFTRVETTQNYITNETTYAPQDSVYAGGIIVQQGAQVSKPINMNGYWNVNNNTTHSILIEKLKSNFNTSLGFNYRRLPGRTNEQTNISSTYSGNIKFALASNFSENFDFNIYYDVSSNLVNNSIESIANTNYTTQTTGAKLNWIFGGGFVFRNDIYYQKYNGIEDSFDSEYVLWNMSVARKFLKNDVGELELSVFDLLGQNQSFSQSVNPAYVEEVRTEVLQQYFMMTFTYQLRRFSGAK